MSSGENQARGRLSPLDLRPRTETLSSDPGSPGPNTPREVMAVQGMPRRATLTRNNSTQNFEEASGNNNDFVDPLNNNTSVVQKATSMNTKTQKTLKVFEKMLNYVKNKALIESRETQIQREIETLTAELEGLIKVWGQVFSSKLNKPTLTQAQIIRILENIKANISVPVLQFEEIIFNVLNQPHTTDSALRTQTYQLYQKAKENFSQIQTVENELCGVKQDLEFISSVLSITTPEEIQNVIDAIKANAPQMLETALNEIKSGMNSAGSSLKAVTERVLNRVGELNVLNGAKEEMFEENVEVAVEEKIMDKYVPQKGEYLKQLKVAFSPAEGDTLQSIQAEACSRFVSRCRDQPGALILHSVGSGKTRTGICLALGFPKKHRITIITPAGIDSAWREEFRKVCLSKEPRGRNAKCNDENLQISNKLFTTADGKERLSFMNFKTLRSLVESSIKRESGGDSNSQQILNAAHREVNERLKYLFEDSIVIVDEAHHFLSFYENDIVGKRLSEVLATTHRLYMMTGTPFQTNWGDYGRLINLAAKQSPAVLPVSAEQLRNKYGLESGVLATMGSGLMLTAKKVDFALNSFMGFRGKILSGVTLAGVATYFGGAALSGAAGAVAGSAASAAVSGAVASVAAVASTVAAVPLAVIGGITGSVLIYKGMITLFSSGYTTVFGEMNKTIPLDIDTILKLTSPYLTFYNYSITDSYLNQIKSVIPSLNNPTDESKWNKIMLKFYEKSGFIKSERNYVVKSKLPTTNRSEQPWYSRLFGTATNAVGITESKEVTEQRNKRRIIEIQLFQLGCIMFDITLNNEFYAVNPEINKIHKYIKGDYSVGLSRGKTHRTRDEFIIEIIEEQIVKICKQIEDLDISEGRSTKHEVAPHMYRNLLVNTFHMANAILAFDAEDKTGYFMTPKFSKRKIAKPNHISELLNFPRKKVEIEYIPFNDWQHGIYFGNCIAPEFTYQHELFLVGRMTEDDLYRYDGGNAQLQGEMTKLKFMEHMRICGNLSPDKLYLKTMKMSNVQVSPNANPNRTRFNDATYSQILGGCYKGVWRTPCEMDNLMSVKGYTLFNSQMMNLLELSNETSLKELLDHNKDTEVPPGSFGCPKFETALKIICEARKTDGYLPVIYSNFIDNGYKSFSAFLTSFGLKHIVLEPTDPQNVFDAKMDAATKITWPLLNGPESDLDLLKKSNAPVCIILHPLIKEGISFTYNTVMVAMEPVFGAGNQEQVYGRILRRFPDSAIQIPRVTKTIHVLISGNEPLSPDDSIRLQTSAVLKKYLQGMPAEYRLPSLFRCHIGKDAVLPPSIKGKLDRFVDKWSKEIIIIPEINLKWNKIGIAKIGASVSGYDAYSKQHEIIVPVAIPAVDARVLDKVSVDPSYMLKKIQTLYSLPIFLFLPNLGVWSRYFGKQINETTTQLRQGITETWARRNPAEAFQADMPFDPNMMADGMVLLNNSRQEKEMEIMFEGMNSLFDTEATCADGTRGIDEDMSCSRFKSSKNVGTCISMISARTDVMNKTQAGRANFGSIIAKMKHKLETEGEDLPYKEGGFRKTHKKPRKNRKQSVRVHRKGKRQTLRRQRKTYRK